MNGLLTIKEVCEILQINRKTLRKHIYAGRLETLNVGSESTPRYRIRQEDLNAFLEGRGEVHGKHTKIKRVVDAVPTGHSPLPSTPKEDEK